MHTDRLISLAAATLLDVEPSVAIRAAADAGFDAVGLRWDFERFRGLSPHRLRQEFDEQGLTLLDLEVVRLGPGHSFEAHRWMVDLTAVLRPRWLLTVSHHPDPVRTREDLTRLARMLAPYDCAVALEFMAFTEVRDVETAFEIVAAVRRADVPNIAVLIDPLHLARSGGIPTRLPATTAELLAYVQLCDATAPPPVSRPTVEDLAAEARGARLFPGEGALPLTALLRAVPHDSAVSVEVQSHRHSSTMSAVERAMRAMRTTRQVLASALAE